VSEKAELREHIMREQPEIAEKARRAAARKDRLEETETAERVEPGRVLGRLEDLPREVTASLEMEMCPVPAGDFWRPAGGSSCRPNTRRNPFRPSQPRHPGRLATIWRTPPAVGVEPQRRLCNTGAVNLWYALPMRNITVSVPEEVYRQARIRAAEQGQSVSALVAGFLSELGDAEREFERLLAQQEEVFGRIESFRAEDRLSRDELHDRAIR